MRANLEQIVYWRRGSNIKVILCCHTVNAWCRNMACCGTQQNDHAIGFTMLTFLALAYLNLSSVSERVSFHYSTSLACTAEDRTCILLSVVYSQDYRGCTLPKTNNYSIATTNAIVRYIIQYTNKTHGNLSLYVKSMFAGAQLFVAMETKIKMLLQNKRHKHASAVQQSSLGVILVDLCIKCLHNGFKPFFSIFLGFFAYFYIISLIFIICK